MRSFLVTGLCSELKKCCLAAEQHEKFSDVIIKSELSGRKVRLEKCEPEAPPYLTFLRVPGLGKISEGDIYRD